MVPRIALAGGVTALLLVSWWRGVEEPVAEEGLPALAAPLLHPGFPAPTEHVLDEDAERRNKDARERWFEEMHRTAPGTDWREIERENGRREMERRNRLGAAGYQAQRWSEVGSRNLAGRMQCAMLGPDPGSGRSLYAGAALGGLWKSAPDGSSWTPLGDNLYGGIKDLLVVAGATPTSPDVVLVWGGGATLFVTRDDGATWETPAGLGGLIEVRSLGLIDSGSQDTMLILARATVSGVGDRLALFASTDRGASFTLRSHFASNWNGSLWMPWRAAPSASMFVVHAGKCWISTDQGFTFTQTGVIDSGASRAVLAGSEAGNPHLYAAVQVGGVWKLYRSRTQGATFKYLRDLTDFWESLAASPTDRGVVVYAGVETWRSTDQGNSFNKVNNWWDYYADPANRLHADVPGLFAYADPDRPGEDLWYIATDGGLYHSTDRLATVQNLSLSGLGVGQYYSTHTSTRDNTLIQAGSQDQGYQVGIWQASGGSGPSSDFNQIISGDYGHLTSSDGTHDVVFSTYPGFVLITEGETNPTTKSASFPAGANHLWLPPVVANPNDGNSYFFCGDRLWRADRSGGSWNYFQHSSEDFGAGAGQYLSALQFAPSDPNRAYAVNDVGVLYWSMDGGLNWTASVDGSPDNHYFYGNALTVHPTEPQEAFVGGSGYSTVGVRRTTDGGVTWVDAGAGLPATLVYDLAYSNDGQRVYAATDAGAYEFDCLTLGWTNIMQSGTPLTTYWSVEAVPGSDVIRFGTYGRGIWDYAADPAPPLVYFSIEDDAVVGGVTAQDDDVLVHDCITGQTSMYLDMSDVLSTDVDVDALAFLDDGSILLSFLQPATVDNLSGGPNGDQVEDRDLVRFFPTSTGPDTAGTFVFHFDGSDVGLSTRRHDIDALALDAAGNLVMSFAGPWAIGPLNGKDEDLVTFTATSLGASTAGSFTMTLDGTDPDVRLGSDGEDVDALSYDLDRSVLVLSTRDDFKVPVGLTGQSNDLLEFDYTALGADPAGTFRLLFDGDRIEPAIDVNAVEIR